VLKSLGAVASISAVTGISSAKQSPLPAFRRLMWNGKVEEAKKLLDRQGTEYRMFRGEPNYVSPFRYGSPDEDNQTTIVFSLAKLEERSENDPAVYDASISVQLSEWDNDFGDLGQVVDPNDGMGIGCNSTYWQAVEPSRSGVSYTDDRISYGGFTGSGLKMQYDDPGTPTDGIDQKFTTGFSTKLEAISRDVFTGDYNVIGSYVHTWSDNGGYDMSFGFSSLTLSPTTTGPDSWVMTAGDKA
jgi:hypothetical protein